MLAEFQRRILLNLSHRLIVIGKKLQGAADKVVPQKRLFLQDCEADDWQMVRPCFVLSTGRTGTLLLNSILQLSPNAMPMHEPQPELYRPSRRAYEEINRRPDIYREVFKSAREEYLLKSAQQEKVYIETNNQITFFAPIIRNVFPRAVFIHLVRHPADFVRSGIRRKWYTGEHSHDIGRIVPLKEPYKTSWPQMSPIEKMGWLWNETNTCISEFVKTIDQDSWLLVRSEDLFSEVAVSKRIFNFLGISGINERHVQRLIATPQNPQRKGFFAKYPEWSASDKEALKKIATLSENFGYDL